MAIKSVKINNTSDELVMTLIAESMTQTVRFETTGKSVSTAQFTQVLQTFIDLEAWLRANEPPNKE